MEHPLCKICDPPRRHARGHPHKFASEALVVTPKEIAAAAVKIMEASDTDILALIRAKTRERVRRYRARKKEGK